MLAYVVPGLQYWKSADRWKVHVTIPFEHEIGEMVSEDKEDVLNDTDVISNYDDLCLYYTPYRLETRANETYPSQKSLKPPQKPHASCSVSIAKAFQVF